MMTVLNREHVVALFAAGMALCTNVMKVGDIEMGRNRIVVLPGHLQWVLGYFFAVIGRYAFFPLAPAYSQGYCHSQLRHLTLNTLAENPDKLFFKYFLKITNHKLEDSTTQSCRLLQFAAQVLNRLVMVR